MKSFLKYLNESILLEDKEGKNINRAEKWIKQNHPEVIGKKLEDGRTITPRILTQEIRNTISNVKMCDCKFLVGATRFYFEGQNNPNEMQNQMNKLNKILKILCTAHADEYDNNFNGISFDELDRKFSSAVQKELDSDKEEIDKLDLIKKDDYEIISIDSFEDASKYGQYTSWCVTHRENMYQTYTKNGLGRFYFCLKPGFEKVEKIKGEDCPMDDYGKSMIAISVNDDGSLNTCTCRWNHDNGGNDNMMDTKQISEFFGVNFYKTFLPYSTKDLWQKYEEMKKQDDDFCKFFGCIKIDNKEEGIIEYKKLNGDKIQTLIRVDDKTTFTDNKFVTLKDGKYVEARPISIGDGAFSWCNSLKEITIPNSVTSIGDGAFFDCESLKEITIPDSVRSIGNGAFSNCKSLTSITIPDSVRSIGNGTFSQCKSLTSITIPDSVRSIGEYAFWFCRSLTSIYVKGDIEKIKKVFEKNNGNKIYLLKPLNVNEGINNYIYYWAKLIKENI